MSNQQALIGTGKRVVVAMSGGVDSAVAAALLQQQGYEVIGCFMRHGVTAPQHDPAPSGKQGCCSINDSIDARRVAGRLNVPLYVLNFERDFARIVDYFVDEYHAGRTPNPCVRCNDWIKFGKLFDYADAVDADFVATGHYARIHHAPRGPELLRGIDPRKDQSYVLFGTPLHRLHRMLLPIGSHEKPAVRALAREWGLPVFDKPDSQEICFVPDQDYANLIRTRDPLRMTPGPLVDRDGRLLGEHAGHQAYTIGQRRGLSVSLGHPIYVIHKDAATNTITVGEEDDLLAPGLIADEVNWLIPLPDQPLPVTVKVRSNMEPVPAVVEPMGEGQFEVRFHEPVRAVSPGQAVVCYAQDRVITGGWIRNVTSP